MGMATQSRPEQDLAFARRRLPRVAALEPCQSQALALPKLRNEPRKLLKNKQTPRYSDETNPTAQGVVFAKSAPASGAAHFFTLAAALSPVG
jgi:hypothetical protein